MSAVRSEIGPKWVQSSQGRRRSGAAVAEGDVCSQFQSLKSINTVHDLASLVYHDLSMHDETCLSTVRSRCLGKRKSQGDDDSSASMANIRWAITTEGICPFRKNRLDINVFLPAHCHASKLVFAKWDRIMS